MICLTLNGMKSLKVGRETNYQTNTVVLRYLLLKFLISARPNNKKTNSDKKKSGNEHHTQYLTLEWLTKHSRCQRRESIQRLWIFAQSSG